MKFFAVILIFSSVLGWVFPSHSKSLFQRKFASMSVNKLAHKKPYIQEEKGSGFSGELKFQYQQDTIKTSDSFFSGYVARFRGGWQGALVENWDWGFKLASSGWMESTAWKNIRNSTVGNKRTQPLGGFGGHPIWLDSFYVAYSMNDSWSVKLGQMSNPYYDHNRYNVIWDPDLTPTGLSTRYRKELGDRYALSTKGSVFLMNPLSPWTEDGSDPKHTPGEYGLHRYMLAGAVQFSMIYDDYDFITQVAFYNIHSKDMLLSVQDRSQLSNAVRDSSQSALKYKSNYSILDISLQMQIKNFWKPFKTSIQLIQNFESDGENFGIVAGGVFGEFNRAGAWNLGYHYFKLNRDATISHFTDSDIGGLGTGYDGHNVTAHYFLNKSVQLGAKYILRNDEEYAGNKTDHVFFGSLTVHI